MRSYQAKLLIATSLFSVGGVCKGFAFITRSTSKTLPTRLNMVEQDSDDGAKVCLVTGSSRGIGRCIGLELAKSENTRLVINYIAPEKDNADKVVKEIKELGGDAIALEADCSKPDEIENMFRRIIDKYGKCDVLVNNAGITRDSLMLRMKPEQWQQVIDINLSGVYYVSKEFLKYATKRRSGKVINIASVVGQIGNPGQSNYAAAKAGVIGLTKSNAKEFASRGITINAVCPGFIETPMTAKLGEEYLEKVSHQIPLGRLGKPEEVAGLVRFLALDKAADYMTGHTFNIDGGIAIGV